MATAYTVTEIGYEEGIEVCREPIPHISLGSRGKSVISVSINLDDFSSSILRLDKASYTKKDDCEDYVISKSIKADKDCALVLAKMLQEPNEACDVFWSGTEFKSIPCTLQNKRKDLRICPLCRTTFPSSDRPIALNSPQNIHPPSGTVMHWDPFPPKLVDCLGWGFETTPEGLITRSSKLLLLYPGACFRVYYHNALKLLINPMYIAWDGKELQITDWNPQSKITTTNVQTAHSVA